LLVSLHGQEMIAGTEYAYSLPDPSHVPGQPQQFANEAIGRVHDSVIVPPNLEKWLKSVADA
jgi:hypothetical protein